MPSIYVASTGTFAGKSAVCMGLLHRMRRDGLQAGYMKPVSVSAVPTAAAAIDEDTNLIRQTFDASVPLEQMAPVTITPRVVEAVMSGQAPNYTDDVLSAYVALSKSYDTLLLEGTNTWAEGAIVGLTVDRIMELLGTPAILVNRYQALQSVDTILTVKRFLGDRLIGVLLNQVEQPQIAYVRERVVPFLERAEIPVLGVLPHNNVLASVPTDELVEHMGGQLIGQPEWCNDKQVDSLVIGSMSADSALSFFRRRVNKAVVTGGDRVALQMFALETNTSLLILTGNMRPSMQVISHAEQREVPIVVVPDDTQQAVERASHLFGHVRFHQPAKLELFSSLMDTHFDFARLYGMLGIHDKS